MQIALLFQVFRLSPRQFLMVWRYVQKLRQAVYELSRQQDGASSHEAEELTAQIDHNSQTERDAARLYAQAQELRTACFEGGVSDDVLYRAGKTLARKYGDRRGLIQKCIASDRLLRESAAKIVR